VRNRSGPRSRGPIEGRYSIRSAARWASCAASTTAPSTPYARKISINWSVPRLCPVNAAPIAVVKCCGNDRMSATVRDVHACDVLCPLQVVCGIESDNGH